MQNFKSKRKQDNIEPAEVRDYVLKVPLNRAEREYLDSIRGRHSKAETMRFLLNEERPPIVPELNAGAWIELSTANSKLSTANSNLNQIAKKLNIGEFPEVAEIKEQLSQLKEQLSQFCAALVGAEISRGAE